MWTRKELKDKAKGAFKANYWKSVLMALIVVVVVGGMSGYTSFGRPPIAQTPTAGSYSADNVDVDIHDGVVHVDVDGEDGNAVHVNVDGKDAEALAEVIGDEINENQPVVIDGAFVPGMVLVGLSAVLLVLVIMAIVIALYAFIFNPMEVGARRFFLRNLNQPAEVKEIGYAYDNNYIETVKTVFLRDLFIFLWSLLLIVPGIYKSYEYRMIPYLLAEDPTMTKDRAFAESKQMMDGQKWNTFVLDLSFLGWNILSALTLGILGIFYVGPYQAQTNAALYEKLRYGLPAPEQPMPTPPAPAGSASSWPAQPYYAAPVQGANAPMQGGTAPMQGVTAPMSTDLTNTAPMNAAPVIVPASQPPVPPFAAVGAETAGGLGATAGQVENPEGFGDAENAAKSDTAEA